MSEHEAVNATYHSINDEKSKATFKKTNKRNCHDSKGRRGTARASGSLSTKNRATISENLEINGCNEKSFRRERFPSYNKQPPPSFKSEPQIKRHYENPRDFYSRNPPFQKGTGIGTKNTVADTKGIGTNSNTASDFLMKISSQNEHTDFYEQNNNSAQHNNLEQKCIEFDKVTEAKSTEKIVRRVVSLFSLNYYKYMSLNKISRILEVPKDFLQFEASKNPDVFEIDSDSLVFRPKVKLCEEYVQDRKCSEVMCSGLHLCFAFVFKQCFDIYCPSGHKWETKHNLKILNKFGLNNRFVTPGYLKFLLGGLLTRKTPDELQLCKEYDSVFCVHVSCLKLHICFQFIINYSLNKEEKVHKNCRKSHDIRSEHNRNVFKIHKINNESYSYLIRNAAALLKEDHIPTINCPAIHDAIKSNATVENLRPIFPIKPYETKAKYFDKIRVLDHDANSSKYIQPISFKPASETESPNIKAVCLGDTLMTPVNDYSNDAIRPSTSCVRPSTSCVRPSTSCVASAIQFLKEKFISFEQVKISDDLPTTSIPCTTEENLSIRSTISLKENFPGSIVNLMDSPMEHVAGNIKPYVANNSRVNVTQDKIILPEWSNSLGARSQADDVNSLMKLVPAEERAKETLDKNLIDMRELVENYKSTGDCTSIDTGQQEEIITLFLDTNSMDSTQVGENSKPAVGYTNSIVKELLAQSTKSSEDHNSLDAVNLKETVKLCTDNNSMDYYVKPIGDNHSIDSVQFSNNDESPEKYNSLNTVELVETFKLSLDNNSIDLVQAEEIAKSTVDSNSMDEGQLAENVKSIGDCTSIDTDQQEEIITLFMDKNSMPSTQVGENSKPAVGYTNSIVKGQLAQSTKSSEDHNSLDAMNLKKAVKLCTDNNSMDYSYVKPTGDSHSMDSGQLSNNDESPEKYNSLNTAELVETVQPLFDNNLIDLAQVEEIAKSTVDSTSRDGDNNLVDTGQLEEYDSLALKNMSKNSVQGEENYKSTSSNSMGIGLLTENDKLSGGYISTYTVQCEENVQLFMNNDLLESIQAEENDKLTAVPYSMDTVQLKENFRMGLSLENNLQDNGRHLDTVKLSECNIAMDTENQIENATFFMDKNSLGTLKVEESFELNVMASSVSAVEVAPENKSEIFLEENLAFLNKHPINEPDCRYRVQEFEANNAATISEPLNSTILAQNNESVMENMYKSTENIAKFDASKLSSRYDNFGSIIAPQHPLMHNASAINNNMPAISDLANSCTDAITSCQASTAAIGSVELNTEVFESTDKLFCNNSIEDCHKSSSILLQDSTMTTDGMKISEVNSTENKLGDNLLNSPDSLQDIPTVKPTVTNLLEIAVQSFLKTKLIDQSLESQLPKTTWAHDLVGNIEIPEICYYSVMEKCKYEEKCCSRLHCIRHFHWQIKGTDDKWYNLLNEQVFQLEAAYCDVNVEETTLVRVDPSYHSKENKSLFLVLGRFIWTVNFIKMEISNSSGQKMSIRRLCTEAINGKEIMENVHLWYFLDTWNEWVEYGKRGYSEIGSLTNTITSATIENHYRDTPHDPLHFNNESYQYSISFDKMHQLNEQNETSRMIRRRPKPHLSVHGERTKKDVLWSGGEKKTKTKEFFIRVTVEFSPEDVLLEKKYWDEKLMYVILDVERLSNSLTKRALLNYLSESKSVFVNVQECYRDSDESSLISLCTDYLEWRFYGNNVPPVFEKGAYVSPFANISIEYCRRRPTNFVLLARIAAELLWQDVSSTKSSLDHFQKSLRRIARFNPKVYYPEYVITIADFISHK